MYNAVAAIKYDLESFSASISDLYPQELWITRGSDFQSESVYNLFVESDENGVLSLILNTDIGNVGLTPITTSNSVLFHVKMKIKNNKENVDITFIREGDPDAGLNNTYANYNPSSTADLLAYIEYDPVNFLPSKTINFPLSPIPQISSFYINTPGNTSGEAGTGDVLTINGNDFGDTFSGYGSTVSFRLADYQPSIMNEELPFYKIFDASDIVSWSNTKIELRIPSVAHLRDPVINDLYPDYQQYPGSGTFKVQTAWGTEIESASEITINYAVSNFWSGWPTIKTQYAIPRKNCVNGYKFRVSQDLKNDYEALETVKKALLDWSTELGITFELDLDDSGDPITNEGGWSKNSYNTIFYTCVNANSNLMGGMSTLPHNQLCDFGLFHYAEFDIGICDLVNWEKNWLNTVDIGEADFYTFILHEFGHILGLLHSVNTNDLMLPTLSDAERVTLSSGSINAINGATHIINFSENLPLNYWHSMYCDDFEILNSPSTICFSTPLPPQNFKAFRNSTTSIKLTWDIVTNATNYIIESSTQPTTGFSEIANLSKLNLIYYNSGLNVGTSYYYRIKTINSFGESSYSFIVSATTLLPDGTYVPKSPSNANASVLSPTENQITWDNYYDGGQTDIKIERSTSSGYGYTEIATVTSSFPTYTDNDIEPNTRYFYRVVAFNDIGESGYSNETSIINCSLMPYLDYICGSFNSGFNNTNNPFMAETVYSCTDPPNVTIGSGAIVLAQATNRIILQSGIKAVKGARFKAMIIQDCEFNQQINIESQENKESIENIDSPDISSLLVLENDNIQIYPNPSKGIINIRFNLTESSDVNIFIYNTIGTLVKEYYYENIENSDNSLNLHSLNTGIYLIRFQLNNSTVIKKFIME